MVCYVPGSSRSREISSSGASRKLFVINIRDLFAGEALSPRTFSSLDRWVGLKFDDFVGKMEPDALDSAKNDAGIGCLGRLTMIAVDW